MDDTGKDEGRNKAEQDEVTHGSCHGFPGMVGWRSSNIDTYPCLWGQKYPLLWGQKSNATAAYLFLTSCIARSNILRSVGHVVVSNCTTELM
ncbi:unnamed protein product, partial [Urochloa humidicola]